MKAKPKAMLKANLGTLQKAGIVAGALMAVGTFAFSSWSLIEPIVPYAPRSTVIVLAGREEERINAEQISRQTQIEILKAKCAVRCTEYERQALENLIRQWQREQRDLERLRGNK